MPSTDRDEFTPDPITEMYMASAISLAEFEKTAEAIITLKQKEAQLHILQKVNTIRKGESASVEVIAKHVSEELTALQSPDREEDKR